MLANFKDIPIWRASGITSELQLYCTANGALVFAALMLFAGWFHYHKAAPKLAWFQDVESMLNMILYNQLLYCIINI
ncbi:unnamed protein product [Lathyrus sativus]|nr:unnamed protein product [Lathyrus sativus]